jgi:predicted nucleic acid-binding protein
VSFLLDTNVVSEIWKKTPDPGVSAWFASVPAGKLFLSVLVVGEIRQGIERLARKDPAQAGTFEQWLSRLVSAYGDHVVPITARVAEAWGRLSVPDPVPVVDGLMAATALVHGWTLVTRNARDVKPTGVRLLNPFSAPLNRGRGAGGAGKKGNEE